MVGVKFADILVKNINKTTPVLSLICYVRCVRTYLLSCTSRLYLYLSFIIADLAKHGTDMAGKQTTFALSGGAKVKDEDYYQSKNASLFKSCAGLRFSGLQDYDTFLEKFFSILNISGFVLPNGADLLCLVVDIPTP